jgi:hypothetical protein
MWQPSTLKTWIHVGFQMGAIQSQDNNVAKPLEEWGQGQGQGQGRAKKNGEWGREPLHIWQDWRGLVFMHCIACQKNKTTY